MSDLTLTAHNLAYTYSNTGGSLSGTIGFSGSATLSLSDALSISATVNASYDLGTGVFNAILGAFSFSIGDSLSLSVTSADLNYQPDYATTINTSTLTFTAGGTGTIPVSSVAPFVVGQTITINNQQFTINSINGSNLNVTSSSAATVPSGSVAPGKVATILLGVTGATAFVGYGSVANNNAIGVELANGTLALAVFYTSGATPSTTYAFQAGGSLSLVGFSGIGLTVSGNVLATSNNSTSSVTESIAVDSTPADNIGLSVAANTTTVNTSGVTISIASFVNITGNFGFSTTTTGNVSTLAITADNVNASLSAGNVSVTVGDAGLGLIIVTANTNTPTPTTETVGSYALIADGGTDTLAGIPNLSFSASGLQVLLNNTGVDPDTLPGASQIDGNLTTGFSAFDQSDANIEDVEGTISLNIANLVSLQGNFVFEEITPQGGATEIIAGASDVDATIGTTSTNVSINGASLSLLIVPGSSGGANNYAIIASGGMDSINGITDLKVTANGLMVEVNSGITTLRLIRLSIPQAAL